MPVVAASITDREWDALEQQYDVKPKTKWQLAMEGHWLVEGIDCRGVKVRVVHKVPAVLRFVLLHGFGPVLSASGRDAVDARAGPPVVAPAA